LVVTNPVKSEALLMDGVASLTIPTGALHVLSRAQRAVVGKGVSKVTTYYFGRVGGVAFQSLAKGGRQAQGAPAYAGDPLADLPPPTDAGLKKLGDVTAGGKDSIILNPGIYGAWDFEGNCVVQLRPGRYVLKDGMSQRGHASIIGDGVLIINEGQFESNGFGKLQITAPRQGPYTGLVFYQPKTNTQTVTINTPAVIAGTLYLPNAKFLKGGVTKAVIGSVVADTAEISGANELIIEGAPFYVPAPAAGTTRKPAPRKR